MRWDEAGRQSGSQLQFGGVGGIRTLGTAFQPYNGLANRRLQPLGHHSKARNTCKLNDLPAFLFC